MSNPNIADFEWPSYRPPLETYRLDYGIGIVGYAGIIRAQQLPAYRLAGYRVVAAADIRADRRELAARDGVPHVYEDYRDLLGRDDVQIVDCAVDHSDMPARVQILRDAARAGKAVLMQKPMATDLKTAEEMVQIAEDHGIPYAVNQNLRFDPAIYITKQFLAPERFGKPGFIHVANISVEGPRFGFGNDGVVMAWQIHAIDSIRWISGGEAVSVYCTNRNNASMYHIEFSSGAVCDYFEYHNEDNFRNVFIKPCYDHCASIGGFIGCMGEFMQSLHEKRPALTNGRDNLMSLRIYFAGQLSAEQRRPVDPRSMQALAAGA